jgi:hypothetical protein
MALAAALTTAAPASARCTRISKDTDVEKIRTNPAGSFCLTQDIVLTQPFAPIDTFAGTLNGKGHTMTGLQNNIFNTLTGTVEKLHIVGANLDAEDGFLFTATNRYIGIVAGDLEYPGAILNVSVGGKLSLLGTATAVIAGGIVAFAGDGTDITNSQAEIAVQVTTDLTTYVGLIAGRVVDGTITQSSAVGTIAGIENNAKVGGFVGSIEGKALISGSSAYSALGDADPSTAGDNSFAGGFAGFIGPGARIEESAAASSLGFRNGNALGGFAGTNFGTVARSVASTLIHGLGSNALGGFIGDNEGTVSQSLADGSVFGDSTLNRIGGFFGATSGSTSECAALALAQGGDGQLAVGGFSGETFGAALTSLSYAIGKVIGGPQAVVGGFNGVLDSGGQIVSSYWTPATTGQKESRGGAALRVETFLSHLPPGFPPTDWKLTKGVATPYLDLPVGGDAFQAQLAMVIQSAQRERITPAAAHWSVYVFPPLGQFNDLAYAAPAAHEDAAALGAVYAILGRGIGMTDGIAKLQDVTIDTYFDDATQTTSWRGLIKQHATRGPWTQIAAAEPIGESNIIGAIRAHQTVIVSGSYDNGDGRKTHDLLATSFTDKKDGTVTGLVADDPWTGRQVLIDPISKAVTAPANFPLQGFNVTRFQTVTLN